MALVNLNKKLNYSNPKYSKKVSNVGRKRLLVIIGLFLIASVVPSFFAFMGLQGVMSHGKGIVAAYKAQQFNDLKKEVSQTKGALQQTNISLGFLFWLRLVPVVGGYYLDVKNLTAAGVEELAALEKILTKLEPDKDELQFNGFPKSGPERITQALNMLNKSLPLLDEVSGNYNKAGELVKNIDTSKYPEKFKGKEVRKNIQMAKDFIMGTAIAVTDGKDALALTPEALGIGKPKNYLLLFQNDKEIRPTGGFLTAFATLSLNNGQVDSTTSDDIYRLDEKLLNVCLKKVCPLTPPAPIIKYLPEVTGEARKTWSMRDSNLSPDVPTSAAEFERMYELLGDGLPFDGIIFIDTQVVESLIGVTGPIDVFGTRYSSDIDPRCDCSNVIYELESYAQIAAKGEKDRKAVLGVLMQQILAKSLGSDVEKMPKLAEAIATLANDKHIMFYMHNQSLQKSLAKLNWIGEIKKDYDGDYLHINDSNFAGGKSNIYVNQSIAQEINIQKDNTVNKKIIIEYDNPQPFGAWLNTINRDYVRFYTPLGSKLLSNKGSEAKMNTLEELGKTVFDAFVQVRPKNLRKLEVEYSIPYKPQGEYKLFIQKQPGAKNFHYIIKINGKKKAEFDLTQDKELKLSY